MLWRQALPWDSSTWQEDTGQLEGLIYPEVSDHPTNHMSRAAAGCPMAARPTWDQQGDHKALCNSSSIYLAVPPQSPGKSPCTDPYTGQLIGQQG